MEDASKVEFQLLEYECISEDTVVFKLEDGAKVKVKVDLDRVGVATNLKNPDGTPRYFIKTSLKINIIPPDKKFVLSKNKLGTATSLQDSHPSHIA